jgi:hypothetical protein
LLSRSFLSGFWIWNHLFCPFSPHILRIKLQEVWKSSFQSLSVCSLCVWVQQQEVFCMCYKQAFAWSAVAAFEASSLCHNKKPRLQTWGGRECHENERVVVFGLPAE